MGSRQCQIARTGDEHADYNDHLSPTPNFLYVCSWNKLNTFPENSTTNHISLLWLYNRIKCNLLVPVLNAKTLLFYVMYWCTWNQHRNIEE